MTCAVVLSQLTVPLPDLQQYGLLQHDGESLVLLVLLVVNDLHIQQLPGFQRQVDILLNYLYLEDKRARVCVFVRKNLLKIEPSRPVKAVSNVTLELKQCSEAVSCLHSES